MLTLPQPRSLVGLILLGFFLVALPLIVAVVGAVLHAGRLEQQSRVLLEQGLLVTRQGESLSSQLVEMERNARQYQVVGDPDLRAVYQQRHQRFMQTVDQLEALRVGRATERRLENIRQHSTAIRQALFSEPPQSQALALELQRLDALRTLIGEINQEGRAFIDKQLNTLQQATARARRQLALQSALAIPAALVLALIFTVVINRPVRQLRTAIGRLGRGEFARPVRVSGPPELRTVGERLDWLRQRLGELEEQKNRFLRHMSHELKTPLASLHEGTALLMDGSAGELNETQRDVARLLRSNAMDLQQMILNLLDFSAWQEKTARLNRSDVDLAALVRSVADQQRLVMSGRDISLDVEGAPVRVYADRDKLRTALDNLVSNAVKYSPDGGRIQLSLRQDEDWAVIDIRDQGPGVPIAERERVFEPFFQGDTPHAGSVRGTGIGLSVVKECISAHGGDIQILDSAEGAHFRIRLPQAHRG